MKQIDNKLLEQIKNLSELEVLEMDILFAKFNKLLFECYEEKISYIQKNIDDQIIAFGKKIDDYTNEKNSIVTGYINEFQTIYNQRKEQYYNIIVEIQELQANQKIALANFVTFINKNSEEPLDNYEKKLSALITKYDAYDAMVAECEKKLDDCITASIEDFNEIVKYRNSNLEVVKKQNPIINFFSKLLKKFTKKEKFEKEVIEKIKEELSNVEIKNSDMVNIIEQQTIDLIAKIEEVREQVNLEFKLAIQ